MKKVVLLSLIMAIATPLLQADGNNFGAASYLDQGVGARAAGLGGAFVALADDATAGYWNPAGLTQMDLYNYQVGSQLALLQNGLPTSYLSYAFQVPNIGVFSLSWINHGDYGGNKFDGRNEMGEEAEDFGSTENAFLISYGGKVYNWVKGLRLGLNLKILQQSLADKQAFGHGLDLAALWQPVLYWDHTVGLNIQNLYQILYWDNSADNSLVNAKLGVALKFFPSDDELYFNRLITTMDLEFTEFSRMNYHVGSEYWPIKSVAIRAGFNNGQDISVGASYKPEYYEIDYSFHYELSELAAHQHRFSILLRFK